MIITRALPAGWTSLARRGMLWSEVQVFDVSVLAAGGRGPSRDPDCYELLFCAEGSAGCESAGRPELRLLAGQCAVLAPDGDGEGAVTITAGDRGATLVRVRALPAATSNRLPPRRPSVDWSSADWPSIDGEPAG